MSKYKPTIGLEIHAELRTKTKMFCSSKNNPDEKKPNVNICPVCMGHPGTLPVINKRAVESVLKLGVAIGGKLAGFSEFDRKNYFYPDIPKGYQISQYKFPLVSGGVLNNVKITRVHLEEDTARSSHEAGNYSLIDFNRAGVPLMELVTEPVINSAEEAGLFARELQLLLKTLNISEANMEKGEMRVEANISVSNTDSLGTKVEVKNLNSFRSAERAIDYEIKRHIDLLETGEEINQETRGWDEDKQATFSQRSKENSNDYRYFPEPDLPKLYINKVPEWSEVNLRKDMPELPWERRERYIKEFKIKAEDANMIVSNFRLQGFFDSVLVLLEKEEVKTGVNYITSDLSGLFKENEEKADRFLKNESKNFADLIKMVFKGDISSRGAKDILFIIFNEGGKPDKIAKEKNLIQKSDEGELKKLVEDIIKENTLVVEEYKKGKEASLQFLIGQGMKKTKGSANPSVLKKILEEML